MSRQNWTRCLKGNGFASSLFPHVSAAILLAKKGMEMNTGEGVKYTYTDTRHNMPKAFIEENVDVDYDKDSVVDFWIQ